MGLAAGQARLLSITARLSDNEHSSQSLAYAKQRLADSAEQITTEYNEALDSTKLTVLTGFNGSVPNYTDISYALMTGLNTVACGKQYVVTDAKGRILVSNDTKTAFDNSGGDINKFLYAMNVNGKDQYTQIDIEINNDEATLTKISEAWDKYFASINKSYANEPDVTNVEYTFEEQKDASDNVIGHFPCVSVTRKILGVESTEKIPINYDGSTQEQRELYDYAMALSKGYSQKIVNPTGFANQNSIAKDPANADAVNYLKNIFYQMQSCGYVTSSEAFHLDESKTLHDNTWFEEQLKKGKLFLKAYSSTENTFVPTTLSDDSAIQEVADEKKIAMAEAKYTQDMEQLEREDQKFDLELKKLDTEHNALQTEYDALKSVVDKNIEKSFNAFS